MAYVVGDLRYFGPGMCSATCSNLLAAPVGSSGFTMAQLGRDGEDVIWPSLDPTTTTTTDIEVLDGRDLAPLPVGRISPFAGNSLGLHGAAPRDRERR